MIYQYFDPLQARAPIDFHAQSYVINHFRASELGCKCCGKIRMARGFAEQLVVLRDTFGLPMIMRSGCRCKKHNTDEGGHQNSAHLCDISTKHTSRMDWGMCGVDVGNPSDKLISTAIALGWSVGIAQTFAHLDRIADYSHSKSYQRLYFYQGVSSGPREYWQAQYGLIKGARTGLQELMA